MLNNSTCTLIFKPVQKMIIILAIQNFALFVINSNVCAYSIFENNREQFTCLFTPEISVASQYKWVWVCLLFYFLFWFHQVIFLFGSYWYTQSFVYCTVIKGKFSTIKSTYTSLFRTMLTLTLLYRSIHTDLRPLIWQITIWIPPTNRIMCNNSQTKLSNI